MARMSIFNPNMAKLLPKFMKADETDVALSHACLLYTSRCV